MCLNGANVGIHGLFQAWFSSTGHLNMQNDQNLDDGSRLCDGFCKDISRNTFSAVFCCSEPHTADADGAGSAGCFAFTLYFLHTSHHWQHSQSCSHHKRSSLIETAANTVFFLAEKDRNSWTHEDIKSVRKLLLLLLLVNNSRFNKKRSCDYLFGTLTDIQNPFLVL